MQLQTFYQNFYDTNYSNNVLKLLKKLLSLNPVTAFQFSRYRLRFLQSTQQMKKFFQTQMNTIAVSASVSLRRSFISNVSYLIMHLDGAHSSTSKHDISSS